MLIKINEIFSGFFLLQIQSFPLRMDEVQDRNIQLLISEIFRFWYVVIHQN